MPGPQGGERGEEEGPFELLVPSPGGLFASDRGARVPGGRGDPEPGGELGVGVAAPQMVQGEESLTAGGQTPPPGPDLPSSCSESSGQVPQGAAVQIDSGRVDKHAKLLVNGGSWS